MSENNSAPAAGTITPGWNDPPNVQYSSTPATRTRLGLNKRVPFPLQKGTGSPKPTAIVQPNQANTILIPSVPPIVGTSNSQHPIAVVHPMPNTNASPPSQTMPSAATDQEIPSSPSEEPLPDDVKPTTLGILRLQLTKFQESLNVRLEEIERRIGVMEQMWNSGTLSTVTIRKIHKIAKAIEAENLAEAMETYTSLVLSHSNECSTWSLALRHIILSLQPNNPRPSSICDEQKSSVDSSPKPNRVFVPAMPRASTASGDNSTKSNPVQHI